jgi:acyl-ACP thioesterase
MYTFDSRIRYSEVDEKEHLTLTALLDYFQDCSTFQSDDSGVGMDYLRKMHMAWVLNSWQIDVTRFPKEGDRVTIGTIPYTLRGPLGYRNFFMNDAEGNRLAAAQTIWTLLDMEEGIPVNAPQEVIDAYPIGEKLDMEYLPRKIRPAGEGKELEAIQVMKHHLDANHHVNNGQYVRMAMELIPEGKMPWRLRAEYKAQARLGDTMYPVLYSGENVHTVSLNDAEGNPYAIVEFTL